VKFLLTSLAIQITKLNHNGSQISGTNSNMIFKVQWVFSSVFMAKF